MPTSRPQTNARCLKQLPAQSARPIGFDYFYWNTEKTARDIAMLLDNEESIIMSFIWR